MSFNPGSYQPTDQEWLVSPASYAHLCQLAAIEVRSRPATARRLVNRFMQLAKRVDYRLSKLEFDISDKPGVFPLPLALCSVLVKLSGFAMPECSGLTCFWKWRYRAVDLRRRLCEPP